MALNFGNLIKPKKKDRKSVLKQAIDEARNMFKEGVGRVKKSFKEDPLQYTPLSMREKVVPAAKGLSPILGKQRAEDVGYGLRGALSITPFRKPKDKYKPETKRQKQASKLGRGLYGTALMGPKAITKLPSIAGIGGLLGGGIETGRQLFKKEPLDVGKIGKQAKKGGLYGVQTAPTQIVSGQLVGKLAKSIPALNQLTDKSIQKTLPKATQPLKEWFSNVGRTGAKRLIRAVVAETPVEAITYGITNKKEQEKLLDSVKREAVENLVFNIGFAGVNTGTDALTPLVKKSVSDAIQMYKKATPQEKKAGFVKIPGEEPTKGKFKAPEELEPKVERPEGINLERLDITSAEKRILKNTINKIKPELEKSKGKTLTDDEVIEAAQRSEMLQKVTTRGETKKATAAILRARQKLTELDKDVTRLAKEGDTAKLKSKMGDLIESIRVVSSTAADTGRKLQKFSVSAKDESVRQQVLKEISKVEEDTDKILKEAVNVDWDDARSITKFFRKFVKPSTKEILDEYRYNNMLSNPLTHLRNLYSNVIQTALTRPLTIAFEKGPLASAKYMKGALGGLPEGIKGFVRTLKGQEVTKKPDLPRMPTQKLPRAMTLPTRLMEAGDKFFTPIIRQGMKATGASDAEAEKAASYSLFRAGLDPSGEKGQGHLLRAIDKTSQGIYSFVNKVPGGRWFVPFIRTPINFAKQWLEYSPAGLATLPGAKNKNEQFSKAVLGSIATAIGASLASAGRTTWETPRSKKEKKEFYATGRKRFSVKIGDKWVPMMYAGPFALALALPAAVKHFQEESGEDLSTEQMDDLGKAIGDIVQFTTSQTPLSGLNSFLKLISGESDYTTAGNIAWTAQQAIPFQGLVRYITTSLDPVYRKGHGFVDSFKKNLPLLSKSVEAYKEPSGEPAKREAINKFLPYSIGESEPRKSYTTLVETRRIKNKTSKVSELLEGGKIPAFNEYDPFISSRATLKYLNKFEDDERKTKALQKLIPHMDDKHYQAFMLEATMEERGLSSKDRMLLLLPEELRAVALLDRLSDLKEENQGKKFKELQKAGIVTEQVGKEFSELYFKQKDIEEGLSEKLPIPGGG